MIQKIGIIGAGLMGQSMATAFCRYGLAVHLFDPNAARLEQVRELIRGDLALLASEGVLEATGIPLALRGVRLFDNLREAVRDCAYVIEAAPEIMALKQDLLADLDALCPAATILASNTSSLPLEEMMRKLSPARKQRTMICHWYNPAHLVPIAELSFFGNTTQAVYQEVADLYQRIGKQTVRVLKDVPGLVANRIQQAVAREVFSLIEQGVADAADIDKALTFGPAFRYATTGQLEIADFGGLDIWYTVGNNLLKEMDNSQSASPVLKAKIDAGKLGFKTGEGFFPYPADQQEALKTRYYRKLIAQLKVSQENSVQ